MCWQCEDQNVDMQEHCEECFEAQQYEGAADDYQCNRCKTKWQVSPINPADDEVAIAAIEDAAAHAYECRDYHD